MGGGEPNKVKMLCSFGGEFVREQGKPFYLGGKTRLVAIDRSSMNFRSLVSKMSEVCDTDPRSIDVRFQLPEGTLDWRLVSVENDDDVHNMIDEFDPDRKIPIFLFTAAAAQNGVENEEEVDNREDGVDEDNVDALPVLDSIAMDCCIRGSMLLKAEEQLSSQGGPATFSFRRDYQRNLATGPSMSGEMFRRDSQSLVVGQEYEDVQSFRNALTSAAIGGNFELHMIRSDQRRVTASFMASDGKMKLKAMLPSSFASEIHSGNLQNLGLIRILDYTCNTIPNQPEKALIITKCEVVSPALEEEIKTEVKKEDTGIVLKPKQEIVAKSAAQIVHEQRGNSVPVARMAISRRVHPLVSLNPYQGIWTIKVRVTNKGNLRSYRNARGEGVVFNVELTEEDGTQIQATMFNEAANKFYPKFELGKVYYISRGTLKLANKQFKTVQNDYEMTLNENSIVEEAEGEGSFIPETKYNFVKIDQLGSYVNGRELVDVIGVVQNVSPTLSVRRRSNNETIPKRDIVIADDSKKTVTVSLWNDLATQIGQELLDMADKTPVIAIKSLKVGDFQGVSLSTLGKSTVTVNPDLPESKQLRSWYDSEGKDSSMSSIASSVSPNTKNGSMSMYSDRVFLSHIVSEPSLGQDKPVFFSVNVYISFIKHDQTMWYRACKTCNKKVTEAVGSGYWCEACQKNEETCSLRYIMVAKASDPSGEAWVSVFNDQAEQIIGCTADELDRIKSQEGEDRYLLKLKEATWAPHLFRVSVSQTEYMGEKRQRITVRSLAPIDYSAESRYLLEEISKMSVSQV